MNLNRTLMCVLVVSGLALVVSAGNGSAESSAEAKITFVGKNAIATANGVFHRFKIIESDISPIALGEGSVTVEVDIASLDTDNQRRDDHLRTADFFEVERWPTATVRVHSAELADGTRYRALFDVEIRDTRKTIEGHFDVVSEKPFSVKGSLVIDRMDFGIGTPKTWSPMSITNEVPISFEATLPL